MRHLVYGLVEGEHVHYVGYTAQPKRRRRVHARNCPDWRFLVLGAYPTRATGLEQEQWWIRRLSEGGHGLTNKTAGGQAPPESRSLSFLTRQRISQSLMGHPVSPETREKLSAAAAGHIPSAETRAKLRKAMAGRAAPVGHAHPQSQETRQKISEAMMGNKRGLGHVHSQEARGKMSRAVKAAWQRRRESRPQ